MQNEIIAATRNNEEFNKALISDVDIIFCLSPNILSLASMISLCHDSGKKLYIHIDLAEGVGKDKAGITLLKRMGVDGIISTRVSMIKLAKCEGLSTVQRFFIVDSQSVDTTVESIKQSKCDFIEIMPGVLKKVINLLSSKVNVPIIAGGLIETKEEISDAFESGAVAISTGKSEFWLK